MPYEVITESELCACFPPAIWKRGKSSGETTVECPVKSVPGVVIRVYTSLRDELGVSASKGADALRVLAIDTLAEAAKKPACVVNPHAKGPKYLKRVTGWQGRVADLARETYKQVVARAKWINDRRAVFGIVPSVPSPIEPAKPLPSAPAPLTLLKASDAAWVGIKESVKSGMDADALRSLVTGDTSGAAAVAAMKAVYTQQTLSEQSSHATKESNGVGFNGVDAPFASSLVEQVEHRGNLSHKQVSCVIKMMQKYVKQVHTLAKD